MAGDERRAVGAAEQRGQPAVLRNAVGVGEGDELRVRRAHAGVACAGAVGDRLGHDSRAGGASDLRAGVRRRVVDDDDLELLPRQRLRVQGGEQGRQRPLAVLDRDDDGDLHV